jgi:hypothetical protein
VPTTRAAAMGATTVACGSEICTMFNHEHR